ncbi:Bifunctional dehydrogenase and ferrochelatase [Maublancomyces gigas]|uniref:precorrin-2 dehydrogenase n=1 Tax=Discina gigas TaxID=1032678 RepID=A0ABR3GMY5_9PEZI
MDPPADEFPAVQPGGSLLLAWQVRNRRVLVVGGGNVAAGRILNLLNADALITVVTPAAGLVPEVAHRISQNLITHIDRNFLPTDLEDPAIAMVLTAVDDPLASSTIYTLCKQKRIPVNVADVPPECDFYFGSVHRDGPLQIMVSTNGNGPKLANIVRRQIAATLPANLGEAVVKVGALRKRLRGIAPAPAEGPKRMDWMTRVCEGWSLEELCDMNEEDMEALLKGYGDGVVISYKELRGEQDAIAEGFDGSFGWV